MKKVLALLIAIVCVFAVAFAACNYTGKNSGTANNEQSDIDSNTEGVQSDNEKHDDEQPDEARPYEVQPDNKQPYNKQPSNEQPNNEQPDNKQPNKLYAVGDKLPEISVKTYNSAYTEGTYSTKNAQGKVLVINFWFRSCGPCTGELPYFEQVNEQYGDKVEMVAIHSNNGEQHMIQNFINGKGWSNWKMIFGKDVGANEIYNKFAISSGSYPVTVIVNPEGYITFTGVGTLRIDLLRSEINKALAG
ncbi:MAG: TlpA family protein disulfide reductase [Clostridiales bacterium]|nr:TlpA family protein disulfide reductase [Clostridiales bacterium]